MEVEETVRDYLQLLEKVRDMEQLHEIRKTVRDSQQPYRRQLETCSISMGPES